MFVLYFSRWVVQSNASKKISLAFSRILNKLVGIPFQLVSCLCICHSVTINSKSSLGPVFRYFVHLTVFFIDLYISFLFRVYEETQTGRFVMFLF